ncbi:hypothetical protein B0T14DRAFT_539015 [Immersiella caudata]|uniref:Zn(2)-C6 fungal-type domain-containing protein n=1 Tax=Immersiella caudata TaxID=314043 RepID=A0AA39WLD9_9PEZI|nr:hypothetical protein B0T14DRAFT_539015 [Immersiella caudata]
MDLLDAQASEIRSFLGPSPLGGPLRPSSHHSSRSAPGDNSALSPQIASGSSPPGFSGANSNASIGLTSSSKRSAHDDETEASAKQQRSKRNRYISIACNECKRRKIKCNGEAPCQRCGHLKLQCLYAPNCCSNSLKDSEEFRQLAEQVGQLQRQVAELTESMNALRQGTVRLAPIQATLPLTPSAGLATLPAASAIPPLPLPPFRVPKTFSGPTGISYTVNHAKNTIKRLGYSGPREPDDTTFPPEHLHQTPAIPQAALQTDPIWDFEHDEIARLCGVYEEEMGVMYPIVKLDDVLEHLKTLSAWMDDVRRNGQDPNDTTLLSSKSLLLRVIMCCALATEEHANSPRADRLYAAVQPIIDKRLISEPAKAEDIPFLALAAGYRFLSNDEILAWRTMGHVTRLCFELGLHRRDGVARIRDPKDRRNALYTFWSTYMLDRRWSFSTGLPFVCQDDKIDPKLPFPDNNPYLIAMVSHARLAAKVWRLVDYFEPAVIRELKMSDFEDLDREVLEWYQGVPIEFHLDSIEHNTTPVPSAGKQVYDLGRLRIWMRLRFLQIRIWIYTPVLHSGTSIAENQRLADRAVELAKETIRSLSHLNNTTELYRRLQVFYHQFLTSAISVLFLASTHAPLRFSGSCRVEFYMALELIKGLSARSWVSQRLWRTVRSLKAYAQRVGMEDTRGAEDVAISANILDPGGLAPALGYNTVTEGHAEHGSTFHPTPSSLSPTAQDTHVMDDQNNGIRLQSEIQRIFEGYVSRGPSRGASPAASDDISPGRGLVTFDGSAGRDMNLEFETETFYEQFKDMF